jgi:hypothetical protein
VPEELAELMDIWCCESVLENMKFFSLEINYCGFDSKMRK